MSLGDQRRESRATALLGLLIVVAVALRFFRLGEWGLEGDEIFTLRDSLHPQLVNPRPLLYFLNYLVVRPLLPLDEFGIRLLPAVFGSLAIPVFYFTARRLAGVRAALLGALLLTFSALHVYQSQNARYWSLVFLLCCVYPYAAYVGIREGNRRALAIGVITAVLAALSHPVSVLLIGGLGLWLGLTYLRGDNLRRLRGQKAFRWVALAGAVLVVAIAAHYVPILYGWVGVHDAPRVSEHLLHLPSRPGIKQVAYLVSYVEGLTLPLVLAGALGIYLLWQAGDRSLALLLACLSVAPVVLLVLLSFRTAVSTTYLLPAAPPLFIGAGVLLDRLARLDWELRPRWLLPAMVAAVIIYAGLPTLVSQYRDGRRHDFKGVARWLGERVGSGDVVFSDQSKVLRYYLRGRAIQPLVGDPAPIARAVGALPEAGGRAVWVVAPYAAPGGHRTNPKIGALKRWIYDHCQIRHTTGVARLDFRNNELQVYRCPAELPRAPAASSE